ncbi:peptidase [Streptomyces sp. NRRL F-5755]|uniref:DUF2268 domain-containing protein n=1 Tax=Streptomyces sp. NRRL F-5755 TaxID=1519475 RepID=UPI0006AEFE5D|nr:DUF2268 domain-containing putative Zn-dependent protease [Streptomyces sp. NRRL F-5755]KOT87698.1 peptidase [Streptomyces sp. NRRL F-5755]
MKIVVHDTASAMAELLRRPLEERPDALRDMLSPLQDAMSVGGVDLMQMHEMGCGFRIDREDPRYLAALERMRGARVWERVEEQLGAAWERLRPVVASGLRAADTVHVVLVLGDPDDDLLMRNAGYTGLGGFPGAIHLTMWPTEVSLAKIGYAAAHELHHNVRYANVVWDPVAVTVGEQVVAEGLAEAFVREVAGAEAMGPWATALSGAELDAAYGTVVGAVDVAGMGNLPPYVYGDAVARRMGLTPVGLPDNAGYAVGLRIADAHLGASGVSAAESVGLSAREVLTSAGVVTEA